MDQNNEGEFRKVVVEERSVQSSSGRLTPILVVVGIIVLGLLFFIYSQVR